MFLFVTRNLIKQNKLLSSTSCLSASKHILISFLMFELQDPLFFYCSSWFRTLKHIRFGIREIKFLLSRGRVAKREQCGETWENQVRKHIYHITINITMREGRWLCDIQNFSTLMNRYLWQSKSTFQSLRYHSNPLKKAFSITNNWKKLINCSP